MNVLFSKFSGPWALALMFAFGVVVGGGLAPDWFDNARHSDGAARIETTGAVGATPRECSGGDAVSNFVCRNRWMGLHRYSYR